ncbi:unnamed protein product [Heligmosomoides polygyrus]|uniref:Chitin-binding type-2 domain-containing protein n=1 Tax=Heligmosomoides polygyrus TaxID=6339 RepID=A0A183F686_HELPZ|nr:unnamed protein product [Heligmosomoides polygyrus]
MVSFRLGTKATSGAADAHNGRVHLLDETSETASNEDEGPVDGSNLQPAHHKYLLASRNSLASTSSRGQADAEHRSVRGRHAEDTSGTNVYENGHDEAVQARISSPKWKAHFIIISSSAHEAYRLAFLSDSAPSTNASRLYRDRGPYSTALQGSMHPTLTPEVLQSTDPSGAHPGATMSEDEFMHQLMRLVKAHQVAYNGIQEGNTAWTTGSKSFQGEVMQEKNSYVGDQSDILKHTNEIEKQFELERVRLEKQRREQQIEREFEERQLKEKERIERQRNVVKEIEREAEERRRREREWLEKQRKKALHLQEMQAKAREEFERRQQLAAQLVQQQREEREKLEKQQEQARLALEKKRREEEELQKRQQAERQIEEMKEKEKRKKLEEQRERGRQLMEKQRKEKELQKKQNIAREMKEMQRKQKENEERLWEIVRQTEARQQKEKDEHLRLQQLAREFEERKRKEEEALLKTQQEEEDRKEEALLKIQQEEEDRKEQAKNEAERIRQEGERRQSEEMMRIEAANRIRAMGSGNLLPAMSSRGSSGDNGHAHTFHPEATDFPGRVDFQTSQTLPVDPNVIHFTAAPSTVPSAVPAWVRGPQPWRLPPDPNTNQPEWFEPSTTETPTRILSGCVPEGDCNFSYDQDLLCPHPSDSSRYLQCTPMIGRRGRWTERNCPPTLVFLHAHAACGAQNVSSCRYDFKHAYSCWF